MARTPPVAAAHEVVERLFAADEGRDERRLGVVDAQERSASWTGPENLEKRVEGANEVDPVLLEVLPEACS